MQFRPAASESKEVPGGRGRRAPPAQQPALPELHGVLAISLIGQRGTR